ncbi:MAG: hypothetical protein JSW02_10070 [candidate division WOR-3 bacterium]|nr:MAG: hypothetical protein JSW02_10070 [candidate division WOR-3 bacterium]
MIISRTAVRSFYSIGILLIVLAGSNGCSQTRSHPDLADYLRAEKELRIRIKLEAQILDSLIALQRIYRIDPDAELAKLSDRPEMWIDLIEELKRD